ncbi:hypothetical protein DQ237_02760 [Blastococcus sp. TF02-8]|uniref:hypothetical protein n=1 Tax=Blastococcus sp. TF02-8 TaxID=2250574 RepID=UPI000DEA9D87|nr:hypothetical protein [Blastococcus sp. TF02-8]RBY97845.1 hypothetical protein DQ237_02760 [Blastococcus sp. TF02-8]
MSPAAARNAVVDSATATGQGVLLRDIEDLHDADLDLLMADRLAESAVALRAAVAAATLALEVAGPAALVAHSFGSGARRLAS